MSTNVVESSSYKTLAASGQVSAHACQLVGILCVSSTALTVKVWDNPAAAGTYAVNTLSMAAGDFVPIPATLGNGCYITFGGAGEITVFFNAIQ